MRSHRYNPKNCENVIEYNENKKINLEIEIKQTFHTYIKKIMENDKALSDTPITL
jgi:hypothetical protein